MMLNSQEPEQVALGQERRYDTDTLQKVTALASRLQHEHQDRLTAGEAEQLGMEIGLQPQFMQQAMAQVDSEQVAQQAIAQQAVLKSKAQAEMEVGERTRQEQEQRFQSHPVQRRHLREQERMTRRQGRATLSTTRSEFYGVATTLGLPMLLGFLAYFLKSHSGPDELGLMTQIPRQGVMQFFTLVAPMPVALLQGFLAGRRRVGFIAAATLILALAPTVPFLMATSPAEYQSILLNSGGHFPEMFLYCLIFLPIAGLLGMLGAWVRQQYAPLTTLGPARTGENGQAMGIQHREYAPGASVAQSLPATMPQYSPVATPLQTGVALPVALHRTTQPVQTTQSAQTTNRQVATAGVAQGRRTYLSIDVTALMELRQSATLVAVDYSFGKLRAWIEEIVRAGGGDLQVGLEGSLLASFPTDAQALRTARRVHQELPKFNGTLNRLPMPFRLRCGIGAGTAGDRGAIQRSHELLRSAAGGEIRMGDEVAAAALTELGTLTPLPQAGAGEPAFVWQTPELSG